MKKLFVSMFVLSLFAITTLSAQRSQAANKRVLSNPYAVKKGNAYIAKGVKISKTDQRALLNLGKQVARNNNNYGKIPPESVNYLSATLNNSKAKREWWAIKNKDKWAFGGDLKVSKKMQGKIDAIMAKYTRGGSSHVTTTGIKPQRATRLSKASKRN